MALNAIGIALNLAEKKYADHETVQALVNSFKFSMSLVSPPTLTENTDLLENYRKGLRGEKGYGNPFISRDTINALVGDPMGRVMHIAQAQAKAECLILVLQTLGEKIDY